MSLDHAAVLELLPFFVNGTLGEDERLLVEDHLESCDSCRDEIDELEDLRLQIRCSGDASQQEHGMGPEIGAIWDKLGLQPTRMSRSAASGGLRWIVAGQAAAILILLTLLFAPAGSEDVLQIADSRPSTNREAFETLSSTERFAGRSVQFRVVFQENVRETEMREFLISNGFEIVEGPNRVGAYGLSSSDEGSDEDARAVTVRLRGDPRLLMIERVAKTTGSPQIH